MITGLANHLWQSTVFALAVWILTLALKRNRAHTRHLLWLAASVKFLIPFFLLAAIGSHLEWAGRWGAHTPLPAAIAGIAQPFQETLRIEAPAVSASTAGSRLPSVILALWLFGTAIVLFSYWVRWRRIRGAARAASALPLDVPGNVVVLSSPALLEPGIFGIRRPVLLLPQGIADHLTPDQFRAIVAHELCHVRRHDNLTAAIHMLVEAVFWFHPLVWWMGVRLIEERERACDEEVLLTGNEPQVYAESILRVCRFYLEQPLACAAGVTGANLRKRIEAIMTHRMTHNLDFSRKLLLALAGIAALATPIAIGMAQSRSQAAPGLEFEVATLKQSPPPAGNLLDINLGTARNGKLTLANTTLSECVKYAWSIVSDDLIAGPDWMKSRDVRFDIVAQAPPNTPDEQLRPMLHALLRDRLKLELHHEQKTLPYLALLEDKGGAKLPPAKSAGGNTGRGGRIIGNHMSMPALAMLLSRFERRTVVDMTRLGGLYEVNLEWAPEQAAAAGDIPAGPSIFTAVQEQLGLRLESRKGPLDVLVIDRAEKVPAGN
jgi:bla regulator protein blaR1